MSFLIPRVYLLINILCPFFIYIMITSSIETGTYLGILLGQLYRLPRYLECLHEWRIIKCVFYDLWRTVVCIFFLNVDDILIFCVSLLYISNCYWWIWGEDIVINPCNIDTLSSIHLMWWFGGRSRSSKLVRLKEGTVDSKVHGMTKL